MEAAARFRPTAPARRPVLYLIGALMAAIVALAVAAMLGSMVIAQINQGMAAAVNQSGTLRMQSYRVGMALADQRRSAAERRQRAQRLADELSQRLQSPRLLDAIPEAGDDPVRFAYARVVAQWERIMRPVVDDRSPDFDASAYLDRVDAFVGDIHTLVRALEDRAEHRIDLLRWMQAVALILTLCVVLVTMMLLYRRVVTPLGELLQCADRARQGDFSGRTRFVGPDELGRLGAAMNLMTQGLWQIYNDLEERVAEKTRDLARSNRSLQLLYRSSRMLDGSAMSDAALRGVLTDLKRELKLQAAALCLRDGWGDDATAKGPDGRSGCVGSEDLVGANDGDCIYPDCQLCAVPSTLYQPQTVMPPGRQDEAGAVAADAAPAASAVSSPPELPSAAGFAVADQGRRYGTLRVVPADGAQLEPWQKPLLEALASQLATALNLQGRLRESRRLLLHEERSIIARELHDSLAQSLSYLKIQAVRLNAALSGTAVDSSPPPEAILGEMREGISSAYRQLRELLNTFRLRIGGDGLGAALAETVDDFRLRADLEIGLEDRLPPGMLSPNEEVHVLQIVREALSNATRHARASAVRVALEANRDSGEVAVEVIDDGVGFDAAAERRGHYGLSIMRERAASLGGSLEVGQGSRAGTEVRLRFRGRLRGADQGLTERGADALSAVAGQAVPPP